MISQRAPLTHFRPHSSAVRPVLLQRPPRDGRAHLEPIRRSADDVGAELPEPASIRPFPCLPGIGAGRTGQGCLPDLGGGSSSAGRGSRSVPPLSPPMAHAARHHDWSMTTRPTHPCSHTLRLPLPALTQSHTQAPTLIIPWGGL